MRQTYIGVPPDLLDDLLVKVARIAQEVLANLVGVLQAAEDIANQGHLAALLKVGALRLPGGVDLLDPGVVRRDGGLADMLLELDDVRVGDHLGVGRRENGGGVAVDGLKGDLWRRGSAGCERESDETPHGDGLPCGNGEVDGPATTSRDGRESRGGSKK